MAVYKFRVSFEDYDDISRDIEIKSNQTFADLHNSIHQSIGFDGKAPASFYMSNEHWHKGKEITQFKNEIKNDKISLMEDAALKNFIVDPHQKIYYVFNFEKPWTFHIQLIKIVINEDAKLKYPICVKTVGEAPKQFGNLPIISTDEENDDLDFLNVMEYADDEEDRDEMGFDDGIAEEEDEAEKDEFSTEDFEEEV